MVKRFARDESGAVAVIFAIVFLVVVGVGALAVDVGYWYTCKRQLQSAADAAALAGCNALAHGASQAEAEDVVDEYAQRNFTAPLDAVVSRVAAIEYPGGEALRVTVETDAQVFLSHWLLNRGTARVAAQSVAKVGYLSGAKSPVPWGLAIIQVGDISGTLGGQTINPFTKAESGYWRATFEAGRFGPLTVTATNSQPYAETFEGLVRTAALPSGSRVIALDVDDTTLTSDGDHVARVSVSLASPLDGANDKIEVTASHQGGPYKKTITLSENTGTEYDADYEGHIDVGTTAEPYTKVGLTIKVAEGTGSTKTEQTIACGLLLRRDNYIIQDIAVHPLGVSSADAVTVGIKPLTFEPYPERQAPYQLKVVSEGGTTGNFLSLDLTSVPDGIQGGGGTPAYTAGIVGTSDVVVHLGDRILVETGGVGQPTIKAIEERLDQTATYSFAEWWAMDEPRPDTSQLCVVPILERISNDEHGPYVVVNFATFFVEDAPANNQSPVEGHFIEWTSPSWFVVDERPPGELVIKAVHLTDEYLEF